MSGENNHPEMGPSPAYGQDMSSNNSTPDYREPGAPVYGADSRSAAVPVDDNHTLRNDVHEREKAEFGGFRFGSAFFGWLTAMGTTVLLTGLVAAIGSAIGVGSGTTADQATDAAADNAGTVGIVAPRVWWRLLTSRKDEEHGEVEEVSA
jgi:hypothetical protein